MRHQEEGGIESIDLCRAMALASHEEQTSILSQIEQTYPKSAAEWMAFDKFFLDRGAEVWREIMARRFVESEPDHLGAQLVLLEVRKIAGPSQSDFAHRLATHPDIDVVGLQRLISVSRRAFNRDDVVSFCQAALKRDSSLAPVWRDLVNSLRELRKFQDARKALRSMEAAVAPPTPENLIMLAESALWLKETAILLETCQRILAFEICPSQMVLVKLADIADKARQRDLLLGILKKIKIDKLNRPWMVTALLEITRLNGLRETYNDIAARQRAIPR